MVEFDGVSAFGECFGEELDAVVAEAGAEEVIVEACSGLCAAIEEGIAAADIGTEAVHLAYAIAEMHGVCFAGTSAVFVVGTRREEGAENAMLHVKHRHVLVQRELEP